MSPSCSRQQWKICLGVHIHAFPRELFIEDVRRLSEDYTGEARSWNFSANTWAEDLCAHLCTHQRRTTLLPGWLALHKQTINSPSGLLKFREYLNVCNIYCADLQIWKWSVRQNTHTHTKKKRPLNSWSRAVRVVGVSLCARSTWKMTWQTSRIIQSGQIRLKKANTQNPIVHVLLSTQSRTQCRWLLGLLLWPFSDCTIPGIRRRGLVFQEVVSWRFKLVWENKYTQNYTLCYLKIFFQRLGKQ